MDGRTDREGPGTGYIADDVRSLTSLEDSEGQGTTVIVHLPTYGQLIRVRARERRVGGYITDCSALNALLCVREPG